MTAYWKAADGGAINGLTVNYVQVVQAGTVWVAETVFGSTTVRLAGSWSDQTTAQDKVSELTQSFDAGTL